ncbi:allantoinase AllB [Photobacterium rosenbergii]|uniref:Allantoinase n=1 Tax=Photobacterium rosenbergii TaxID=294936 RepID=A0ABU3ZDP4_9GAMM|nr:allantoinase AllB [Photobacterium rosenbergii]MDV5168205.1 allantoinase AllB [Photobacterium rosenbergii]
MSYDKIIKNGTVILENEAINTDVAIKDGLIAAIGNELGSADEYIDATGLIVSPGMVDGHVHITDPGGPRSEWEGYETATKAAAKGGVTTCVEMPLNQVPATIDRETLHVKYEAGKGRLTVDVASLGGLVPHNIDRLHELAEEGVVGYKCFVSTCGNPDPESGDFCNVNNYELYEGMTELARLGKILLMHAENAEICDGLGKKAVAEGRLTAKDYIASRPVFTEVEAVRRALYLAKETGCKLHLCHLSSPEAIEEVTKARNSGQDVTCESCGHYFAIDDNQFEEIGTKAKCSPPIRDKDNQDRMWAKLLNGEIDFITSDHSPCTPDLKEGGIFDAWGGISSLQNSVDIMFDEGVQKRGMALTQFAKLMATNPADLFGLDQKGRIAVGKDADIVMIKPNSSYVLTADDLEYRNKFSAYEGRNIGAQVAKTLLRGQVVYDLDVGVTNPYQGDFVTV